ncbi:unnamed protein product [Schistosoma haematobium]|nr:unnamed protein product [Schistosoma haematobium]
MTSQAGIETVQLSDYLKNLENACETPIFGYTHQSLEDEMARQQTIEGSSKWIRESVTSSNHDILNQISYITERVETNKDCLHYLAGITSMEDIYSDVTAFNAKRALRLIMENLDNKFWRRKLSGPINRCWQNLGRYSELATIHLKNAADFHQFYYDARHLETKLYDRHKKFLYNRGRFAEMNHEYYTNSSKELRDWLRSQFDHLNYVVNRSKQLIEQSKSLVPIYLRTNRIKSPVNGVMLCDYETPKFKLTAGERIVIIDNMAGGVQNKQKFLLRTGTNQEEDITSEASHNMTSDTLDICETDSDSHSRTEEIDDRSTDSNSYLRYPKPRITTMPYWNFGRGQTSGSEITSSDQTSSTFTENVSPLGQSSSKLHWHIRSIDGKVEALVPSVCVWIPSPDMEAQEKAIKLYKVILDSWNYIIDEQLKICLQFFTILLQRFIESDGLTTDDDEAFKRFLNNLVFSLTEPPTAEAENFNKEFLRLIDATREHWNKTKTFGTRTSDSIHLRRTEIAIFQSLLDWNKAHMRTIKQYEQENIIPLDLSQKLNDLQEQSFHMMETVTLVNDLAQKDKKKLDSLLNQLRIWNKQTKDKNQFNIYSLSSSSDDEWLSSSGSEYINSESTYESIDETETSYIVHSKQIKQPHFTTIFTYDEEMVCSCTTSEEIQSIGTGSSCTTDDEIEDYQKYHLKQDFLTRSEDDFLKENKNFVTTLDKQMLLTLERPMDTKDKPITYKSRKYIDTKDGGRYSVVYIEVAPTEETNILDSTDQENLKPSTISKSTQSEDPLKKTKFTRRTWIEKQHVEEAKSLTKIEESARIIHTRPSKVQITDIGIEARPTFRSIECCTSDLITTTSQSITELRKQPRQITKQRENVQTQTEKHSEDFIYAVRQYAHVKEVTEAQFNQLIQQEVEKLKSKGRGDRACQTYEIMKSPVGIYKITSDDHKPHEKVPESPRLRGEFGCQYQQQIRLLDKQEHYLIESTPKTTMSETYDIETSNEENRAMFGQITESKLVTQSIAFVDQRQIHSRVKSEESSSEKIGIYVENFQQYEQTDEEKKAISSLKEKIYKMKIEASIQTTKFQYDSWTQTKMDKTETTEKREENHSIKTQDSNILQKYETRNEDKSKEKQLKVCIMDLTREIDTPVQAEKKEMKREEHREMKTVKPDHMMSVSTSYAEPPVKQPPPRQLTDTATQVTSVTTHVTESSEHVIVSKPTVQVEAPLVTETASLELPTPEPVRKTSLVEATQFVKRSTVDQQIDTVPVSSSDVGAQTEPHKSLLDGTAHLSLKRTDATSQAKPVQLCMVDSWSEIHAPVKPETPVVPVHEPPKRIQTLEACVQTVKESVCVVDTSTCVMIKTGNVSPISTQGVFDSMPSSLFDISVSATPSLCDCWSQCNFSSIIRYPIVDNFVNFDLPESLSSPLVDSCCIMVFGCSSIGTVTEPLNPVPRDLKSPNLIDASGFFLVDPDYLSSTIQDEDVPLDSGDLEWELVDDNLKELHRCLVNSCVQTEESNIYRPDSQRERSPSLPVSQLPTVNRKNFSVQYIYEPAQENACCQTQPMTSDKIQKEIIIDNLDAETMTDDIESNVAVLLQNVSSTDIRERLIERYYYSAPCSAMLVTDAEVQVNLTGSVYKGHSKEFYVKDISTDYIVEHHIENENIILEESSGHDDSEQTVSGTSYSRYMKRLLHESGVTEVWEKCPPTHSVFDYYQSRREFGSVREQASMAMEEPVTAADVGIQIVFDSFSHSSTSESEISRSESPLSGSSYTYEAYLMRSRLGQVCEVQCQFCPTHIPTASQTDHYGISMQTERHDKLKEDIFEIYQRRLIKDQIAEAWTQVEQDLYTESRMEEVSEPIDVIEERILEITEKKSKKVYSQIKITEEFTEEEDLIVCELGVQTDPFYDQQYFIKAKQSHSSIDFREESPRRLSTTGIQTSVIHLASIISSGDIAWADEDLCEVIKAGIRLLRSDEHRSEDISVSKYASHQLNICARLPTDSNEKVLISSGTQVIPMESDLEKKFQKEWQSEPISFHESAEPFQSDDIVGKVGTLTEETHHMSKILVQLRQRTLQYELFESQYSTSCIQWNNIREVASPRTGLFAPVAMAIRRGWIRLGETNEYVDPMTGVAIPLETAYQQGRIRLTSSSSHYDRNVITNTPVLLLIERVYFSWCKAYLTSVVNTATGEVLSPNLAIANGILETTEDEIRLLDSLTNTWITIEEGAGRQIIQLEPSTPTTESMEDELDEPVSCKVYQLTHVCPGGEPSPWLGPLEAVRLGLLNWETGEVAADWPARPMLRSMNSTGHLSSEDFIPTKWCSFLTAKQAGWLRFIEEIEPQRYITTSGTPNKEPGSLLLSTQVNLLAPSQVSLNYEQDDIEENYPHRPNQYHHEFNIPRTRSDDVFTTRNISTSNLYHPINVLPDTRSVSCTRIDITSPLYNDYKLIPSHVQVRHENDEHSWTSETQIWEEYQETSSRTISPDNARGHQ